jgi:ParB family chromosome partitioning protein
MPVSDVKKIARLFKDKDISSGTKDKLLYKSGRELLETWYVFQQNKAEREKPPEQKPAARKAKKDGTESGPKEPLIESKLQRLLASLPAHSPLPPEAIQSCSHMSPEEKDGFLKSIDELIDNLEKHMSEWKTIRDLAAKPESLA